MTIQEELRVRNSELVEDRRMLFRIGVNIGDVMVDGDNLFGDGVNVAARLEGIVAIRQMYPGHAKQAGMLASSCQSGAYFGRYVVVVDDDIDPTNTNALLWAIGTRSDPVDDIDINRRTWSTALDPMLPKPPYQNSRAIIDACRPWEWRNDFPPVAESSAELREQTLSKWGHLLG